MNAKTWYVNPNGDGTADVYRGDTTTPVQTAEYENTGPIQAVIEVMDAEVNAELPEGQMPVTREMLRDYPDVVQNCCERCRWLMW